MINSLAVASQQGDAAAGAALFANGDNFEWFSATSSVDHYVTYDPKVLEERFGNGFGMASSWSCWCSTGMVRSRAGT